MSEVRASSSSAAPPPPGPQPGNAQLPPPPPRGEGPRSRECDVESRDRRAPAMEEADPYGGRAVGHVYEGAVQSTNNQLKKESQEQVETVPSEPHRTRAPSPSASNHTECSATCADLVAMSSQDILVRVNSLGNEEVFNGSVTKHATLYDFKTMLANPAQCLEKQMQMSLGPLILGDDSKPLVDLLEAGATELQLTLVRQRAFDLKVRVDLCFGYVEEFEMEAATKHTTLGEAAGAFCRQFTEVTSKKGPDGFFSACVEMRDGRSEQRIKGDGNPDWTNMTLEKMGWDDNSERLCIQWDI